MSLLKNYISWFLVGSLTSVGVAWTAGGAIAQTPADGSAERLGTDDDGSGGIGDITNPFELFHRAILAPSMSSEEFQEHQNRAINTEAEAFRQRQQEALRQQQELEANETPADAAVEGDLL